MHMQNVENDVINRELVWDLYLSDIDQVREMQY